MPSFLDPTTASKPKYKAPTGYRMADDVNYPQSPSAIGGIVDSLGMPNGVGSNLSGDSYGDQEVADAGNPMKFDFNQKPNQPSAAGAESFNAAKKDAATRQATGSAGAGPTVIHDAENARLGNGSQDAATLAALGPEYAAEGQRLLNDPSAKRQAATGTNLSTGESFVMPVGNRVSRQTLIPALDRIKSEIAQKKLSDQQSTMFDQQQTMARIPGQNAVDLANVQNTGKVNAINAEGAIQAPTRQAEAERTRQETRGMAGNENRMQTQFAQGNSPDARRKAANDAAIKMLTDAGAQNDPQGQAALAALASEGTVGSQLGGNAQAFATGISKPSAEGQFDAYSQLLNDPQVAKAIDTIKANKQGWFSSSARSGKQDAATAGLKTYIQKFAKAKGLDFNEVWPQINQQLIAER